MREAGGAEQRDLILSWGTVRYASFPDRVNAAAAGGYAGIGMSVDAYDRLIAAGWSDADLHRVLDSHNVNFSEIEVIMGFFAESGPANVPARPGLEYASEHAERTAHHLADEFGCGHLQAVGTFDQRPVTPSVVSSFADLCDRAAEHDLSVALEFVPYTNIPDVRTAAAIVTDAERENGGLCIDTWHFFRGATSWDALEELSADDVTMIQINDGPLPAPTNDLANEAIHGRCLPGEGDFELVRFLATLSRRGISTPVSVEIYSDALDHLPSAQVAERAAERSRELLDLSALHDRAIGEEPA